jgi:hypothetical protein
LTTAIAFSVIAHRFLPVRGVLREVRPGAEENRRSPRRLRAYPHLPGMRLTRAVKVSRGTLSVFDVLMSSTPLAYPQVVSRIFASFRVANIGIPAGERDFCSGFDSRQLH